MLVGQGGEPMRAPARLEAWCREVAAEHVAAVGTGGYDVVGSLDDLVPDAASFTHQPQEVAEEEVSQAAAAAMAQMLVDHSAARGERRRLRRQLERRSAQQQGHPGGMALRTLRRLRARFLAT